MANPRTAAHAANPFHSPAHLSACVLDALDDLRNHHRAFEAVEALITPNRNADDLSAVDRANLGWLLLVLNADMRERIAQCEAAAEIANAQLRAKGETA